MIAKLIYLLCAGTSLLCFGLLWRNYRRTGIRLLFWTSASFFGFAIANGLLFVDLVLVPGVDLLLARNAMTFLAVALLLYGLVWKS